MVPRSGETDEDGAENKSKMETREMIPAVTRPSFFKIISSGHNDAQLRIPPHFRKFVSMETLGRATLCDSSGGHWQVELRRRSEGIFLEDGWQQFVRDHSLGDKEFLTFTYDGDVRFDVRIFERSGCERIGDERKRGRGRASEVHPDSPSGRLPPKPEKQHSGPLEMARAFSSEHPHFIRSMTSYNINSTKLYIPTSFSKPHLPSTNSKIALRDSEGRIWETGINYWSKACFFSAGWCNFTKYSKIECGDACVFELVEQNLLQVHIFRA